MRALTLSVRGRRAAVLSAAVGLCATGAATNAATYTWDTDATTNATLLDGAGAWNKVAGNTVWFNGTTNANAIWADDNDAVFGGNSGSPGAVTIGNTFVRASSITFNKPYTVSDTSTTIRLILTGNVTANESATINSNRAGVLQAAQGANVNWTVASGKTLTFNALTSGQYLVGGNASAVGSTKSLTLNGLGTVAFTALASDFGLGIPNLSTLNMNSGTMTVSARASDGLALVLRGAAGAGAGNAGGTLNQSGGLIDLGATGILNPASLNGFAATVNLNGGTLAVAKTVGTTTGTGSGGAFYFNGGTLRANAGNFTVGVNNASFLPSSTNGGLTSTFVSTGGGTIDSQGFTIDIDQTLVHDPAGAATDGGLTKTGSGTLKLTAVNTYNGNTVVSNGTLNLADNAGLTFVLGASGVNNSITGTGTAILDGDFTFDLTGASTTVGASWLVVNNLTLNETYGSTFSVAGFTDAGGNLWTLPISANEQYVFSESTGTLSVVAAVPEPATLGVLGALASGLLIRRRRVA